MATKEQVIERYNSVGNGKRSAWEILTDVVSQHEESGSSIRLNADVLPQGRYAERAPKTYAPRTKKSGLMSTPEPMTSGSEDEGYLRPNGDKYFSRMWGEHEDVLALRKAREATAKAFSGQGGSPMFALMYGSPGCGKTALIEASFGNEEGGIYTLMGTGDTEVADMIGGYVQTPSGGFEWIDGDLVRAVESGGVYFIDEIGLIDPKVLSIVYGLMDGRRELRITANPERGTIKAHPNFYVVGATNPNAVGVRLSEALLSRFTLQAEMGTDWQLARKLGVPTQLVTASQNLSKKQDSGETTWSPQMREVLAFRDIAKTFGVSFAISNLLASAPEIDRPIVADVLTRVYGEECKPAKI